MLWFVFGIILLAAAAVVLTMYRRNRRRPYLAGGALGAVLGVVLVGASIVYTQSVGQARVIINLGGTVAGTNDEPGFGFKAPWQRTSDWDLFAQTATYAGNQDGTPSYTGGEINGYEVTSSVSGGAQTNFDLSVTYNLSGDGVEDLYHDYRSQERFTKQVVEPKILAVVRDVPTAYKPVDFRGEQRGAATQDMLDDLNTALNGYGVTVTLVNLQNITFTDEVEQSIKNVEVAQQKEAEAQANLRAAEVDAQQQVVRAQAEADAAVASATGQAEANRLLSESLSPQVLQQRYIDALAAGTVFVVPEGSTPLVQVPSGPASE